MTRRFPWLRTSEPCRSPDILRHDRPHHGHFLRNVRKWLEGCPQTNGYIAETFDGKALEGNGWGWCQDHYEISTWSGMHIPMAAPDPRRCWCHRTQGWDSSSMGVPETVAREEKEDRSESWSPQHLAIWVRLMGICHHMPLICHPLQKSWIQKLCKQYLRPKHIHSSKWTSWGGTWTQWWSHNLKQHWRKGWRSSRRCCSWGLVQLAWHENWDMAWPGC